MMSEMKPLPFTAVTIDNGFWHDRQKTNAETTIYSIRDRFRETGRFDAFNFDWKPGMPHKPHIFWDSDIAKWAEAVSYVLEKNPSPALEREIDGVVDLIEAHQDPSGYFNIWFTVVEPENRLKKRTEHELYCAGHLMEAAVAYYHATGKDRFLRLMCRYADYIEQAFVREKTAGFLTPGHPEIELALVKLYRCTGERRYLELSRFFIDNRGRDDPALFSQWANARYAQDHLPVREQTTAEGHAVRAAYLYSGMADIAYEYGDTGLLNACRKIFENIVGRRMYITGGIGSSSAGEAFTIDYDLPNPTAYAETCAAIGLAFFAGRMQLLDPDSVYADTVERAMYNGILSGISLDGKSFFYENPLEMDPRLTQRDVSVRDHAVRLPITQRVEVFDCSCCPPNLSRFIASIGNFLYTAGENTLFIHQFIHSRAHLTISGHPVDIRQETRYPADGKVRISADGPAGMEIAVRIPGWCRRYDIRVNGAAARCEIKKGYAYIPCTGSPTVIELELAMEPQLMEASPDVQDDAGRVALQRGPLVYCLESVDNGPRLRDIAIGRDFTPRLKYHELFGAYVIEAEGYRRDAGRFTQLYQPAGDTYRKEKLTFIPYYAFANRGESEMIVWIARKF